MSSALLHLDSETLRPLVKAVIAEVLADLGPIGGDRLAYQEAEAAKLLGLTGRQLADQRRAGRIAFVRGPRGRAMYSRADLIGYLTKYRESA